MSKKVRKKEIRNNQKPAADLKAIPENRKGNTYEHIFYLLIITIIFLSVYIYAFDTKLDLNGDNAYYFALGKALSQGEGYVNMADIYKSPNNHYPPGYPFILSLFMRLSDSFVFLKLINGIFLLVSLFMFYYLFNHFSKNPKISFVSVLFLLLNSHLLQYGTMLMSEISFVFFSFLCLIFICKTDFKKDLFKKYGFYMILISLVCSYYIRSTGLALFAGLIIYLLIKKHLKATVFIFTGFIILAAPWIIRGQKMGGSSYIKPLVMINPYRPELGNADLSEYLSRFIANLSRYISREIPSSTYPFIQVDYLSDIQLTEWLIGFVILAFIIFGLYKLGSKSLIIITYLVASFVILLLWPDVWAGIRFILPIVPLLLFASVTGLYHAILHLLSVSDFNMKFNALVLLIVGLAFITPIRKLHSQAKNDYPPEWKNYFNVASRFKTEGLKDVVVICRKPMLFYLYSGTYTANYKYSIDDQELLDDLKRKQADYVVLDNLGYRQTYEYLFPAINKNQDLFELVFKLDNPDTYLLRFIPDN
jgi:hypothetical protein